MARRTRIRKLALWMNGERVGTWSASPAGDTLEYDSDWLGSPQARPLSLSLPFRPGNLPHKGGTVRNYFENLLPDSRPIRERLARRFNTATTDAFDLLTELGRDCVGALRILPDDRDPGTVKIIQARPLDEAGVARVLHAALTTGGFDEQAAGSDALRISIAGAQQKTALLWHSGRWWLPSGATPTTHILKQPLGLVGNMKLDLRDSVENEWLCAQILDAYGLPVARCHPLNFEGQRVLAIERFDRLWTDDGTWIMRLPQEDMCQATGTPTHAKYEVDGGPGIDRILDVLNASRRRTQDRWNFFRAQLLFWLMCAPDGHAKNFSVALHTQGAFSMTPLYDVVSAYPLLGNGPDRISPQRVRLAMALRCTHAHWRIRDILRRHWIDVGRRNGVISASGQDADRMINEVIDTTPAALATVAAKIPSGFPTHVADSILSGIGAAVDKLAAASSRAVGR